MNPNKLLEEIAGPSISIDTNAQNIDGTNDSTCPFCSKSFKIVGRHLKHCPNRDNRDYAIYLTNTTLAKKQKSRKHKCEKCNHMFNRLDTHLRTSATCRRNASIDIPPSDGIGHIDDSIISPDQFDSTPPSTPCIVPCAMSVDCLNPFKLPNSLDLWIEADNFIHKTTSFLQYRKLLPQK